MTFLLDSVLVLLAITTQNDVVFSGIGSFVIAGVNATMFVVFFIVKQTLESVIATAEKANVLKDILKTLEG